MLKQLIFNIPLIAGGLGWLVAEIVKVIVECISKRSIKQVSWKALFASGGMPSSHSSSMCALTASVGYIEGWGSVIFAVCMVVSAIVMYDASGVRREAGEQAKALNIISRNLRQAGDGYKDLKEFNESTGHTGVQVLVGCALGIVVGLLYSWLCTRG